jgi:hypothetical protein
MHSEGKGDVLGGLHFTKEESSQGGAMHAMNGNNGTTPGKEQEREVCEEGPGICAHLITVAALFMVVTTLPLSLFFVIKVVQVHGYLFKRRLSRIYLDDRNTSEPLYFAWVDFSREELEVPESSSSFLASMCTRRST